MGIPSSAAVEQGLTEPGAVPQMRDTSSGDLASRLRLLCVGGNEPSWVSLTLQLDALGCTEPVFRWVAASSDALALLRDESFDCLLLRDGDGPMSAPIDDPLSLARAIRAGGCADPIVVVATTVSDESWVEALELNADLLVTSKGWGSSALIRMIRRAVERGNLLRENDRLAATDRKRQARERDEAEFLLNQQRQILTELALATRPSHNDPAFTADDGGIHSPQAMALPPEFDRYYQELLRTYVIMGAGNLGAEIAKLAAIFAQTGWPPRLVLELHLQRVEQVVRGLGNRSTRHVMARADLLALELMMHLGECYQNNWRGGANASDHSAGEESR